MNIPPKMIKRDVLLSGTQQSVQAEKTDMKAAIDKPARESTRITGTSPAQAFLKSTIKQEIETAQILAGKSGSDTKTLQEDVTASKNASPEKQDLAPQTKEMNTENDNNADELKTEPVDVDSAHKARSDATLKQISKLKTGTVSAYNKRPSGIQKTPESLPVLEAFHEFLDSEHRKMRRRMVALTVFFIIIIVAIISAGAVAGFIFLKPMISDLNDMRIAVADMKESSRAESVSRETAIEKFDQALALEKQAMADAQLKIEKQVSGSIAVVKNSVTDLKTQNSTLSKDIGEIRENWSGMSDQIRRIIVELEKMKNAKTTALNTPVAGNQSPSPAKQEMEITFIPKGGTEAVTCLVSIPE